ncbi:flap endonuclease [Epidermidibacterium keratini]|uniref:5'-3' exonuclease n=1 Tax=Epidermidibacterium keratini TaxID=1891644 RepID=A0A7L4YUJ4_9ACTN|nr:flap endonuclease [Epidermidibacterium keratini]
MLLDSASLYFRAFYGVPDTLKGPNGMPNNAIRGFCDMIARLIDTYEPDGLVACLDYDWRPAFRVEAIPSYKTHRVAEEGSVEEDVPDELSPQVPVIMEVLEASGLCAVGADGFEADDVIGTLATILPGEVDVVTGDRDLFQVVDDARVVRVLYTARGLGNMALVDNAWLVDKYGVRADQYADFAALRGDSSDGLPGVKGIGEKSAAVLLAHYGDLGALRAAAADPGDAGPLKPAQRRNIIAASDYLDVAPRVVLVRRDIPISIDPALPTAPVDAERLGSLAAEWGFESSLRRMEKAIAARAAR